MRSGSVYQPVNRLLRPGSPSPYGLRSCSAFIRTFNQFKFKFIPKEMHI